MSVVKDFIFMVVNVKSLGCSHRFLFNSSEVRQHSERCQRFHFNSSEG